MAALSGKKKELGLPNELKLLGDMVAFKNVCYMHLKAMGRLGLQLRQLKAPQLLEHLNTSIETDLALAH